MNDNLEKHNNENITDVEEIQFSNGETKVVVNTKLFSDINKNIEDIKGNLKILEQDFEKRLLKNEKEFLLDAANLDKEQQITLRTELERNLIIELRTTRDGAVKDVIQLLYNEVLFDSFKNKDQDFVSYPTFIEQYLL